MKKVVTYTNIKLLLIIQIAIYLQAFMPAGGGNLYATVPPNVCSQHYDEFAVSGSPFSNVTWSLFVNGVEDVDNNYGEIIYGGEKPNLGEWDPNRNGDTIRVYWKDKYKEQNVDIKLVAHEQTVGGCLGDAIEVRMKYYSPDLDLGQRDKVCIGSAIELQNVSDDKFFNDSYKWSMADVTRGSYSTLSAERKSDLSILETDKILGDIKVSVEATQAESGCVVRDTIAIFAQEVPIVELPADAKLCGTDVLTLDPLVGYADETRWYEDGVWMKDKLGAVLDVSAGAKEITFEARNYYNGLLNKDSDGDFVEFCASTDAINILNCGDYDVDYNIPIAFTPNGDGVNDTWEIKSLSSFPDATVEIYTRWGNLVFKAKGYHSGNFWNGTDVSGNQLGMDSYHFMIDLHNGSPKLIGSVTLVR